MSNGSEGTPGVGMMVAAYVDEQAADQTLDNMKDAKKDGTFYFDDAAVIRQDSKGKVHIKETGDMSTGKGAGIGALIGGVVGLLGGPAGVAWGAAAGAAVGGIAAHGDAGFDQDSLKQIGGALVPGSSAIAAITSQDFVEEVRKQVPDSQTLSVARDLATDIHDALVARQDVLYSLVITPDGIAANQVVSSPTAVAVFGIAADAKGTSVQAGVATADGTKVADAYVPAGEETATTDADASDDKSS